MQEVETIISKLNFREMNVEQLVKSICATELSPRTRDFVKKAIQTEHLLSLLQKLLLETNKTFKGNFKLVR